MKQERYEFVLEAREPISHARESIGEEKVIALIRSLSAKAAYTLGGAQ